MKFKLIFYIILMTLTANSQANSESEIKLPVCPKTPNCVSSQAPDKDHFIAPFKISVKAEDAWAALKKALTGQSRTVITHETENTLHAQATSLVFRFVDDIDVILDNQAKLIHVRSASRTGHSDFGVNRRRIEALRSQLQQARVIK